MGLSKSISIAGDKMKAFFDGGEPDSLPGADIYEHGTEEYYHYLRDSYKVKVDKAMIEKGELEAKRKELDKMIANIDKAIAKRSSLKDEVDATIENVKVVKRFARKSRRGQSTRVGLDQRAEKAKGKLAKAPKVQRDPYVHANLMPSDSPDVDDFGRARVRKYLEWIEDRLQEVSDEEIDATKNWHRSIVKLKSLED